jgi:hypothetical protein
MIASCEIANRQEDDDSGRGPLDEGPRGAF